MVDIHCHILPEIDDGSQSKSMSVEMCKIAEDSGITDIITTPHLRDVTRQERLLERIPPRMEYMRDKLKTKGIAVNLYTGSEAYINESIFQEPDLSRVTLACSRYILIEFSFARTSLHFVEKAVKIIQKQGLVPVLAHPERYSFLLSDYTNVNRLADLGVLLQCNLGSLAGEMGREECKLATEIVNHGLVSFLASDAHRVEYRNTDMMGMLEYIKKHKKKVDTSKFGLYMSDNPEKILFDKEIEYPSYEPLKPKRGMFG